MTDEQVFGLDDELPLWAIDDDHDEPEDFGPDSLPIDPSLPPVDEPPEPGLVAGAGGGGGGASGSAAEIGFLDDGLAKWYSQRGPDKKLTDCMFAALCTVLSFMGYRLPKTFVDDLREASGVPQSKPTNTGDTRKALDELIPDCPIRFGGMSEDDLRDGLLAGDICARVGVRADLLPDGLRHWFRPGSHARHAVALGGAKMVDGRILVHWLDPLGRPVKEENQYKGQMFTFQEIVPALSRNQDNLIRATWGKKNDALPESPDGGTEPRGGVFRGNTSPTIPPIAGSVVLHRGAANEFARLERGTPFRHPLTLEVVTHAGHTANFRLAGRSLDGRLRGVWVNTSKVLGSRGRTLLLIDRDLVKDPFFRN